MSQRPDPWVVDPDDPRAPPMEIWERLSAEQRARVVESLPSEFDIEEAGPPEGDPHFVPEAEELINKLESRVDGLEMRLAEAERRATDEARAREEEARRREETERRLAEALREIERLKRQ